MQISVVRLHHTSRSTTMDEDDVAFAPSQTPHIIGHLWSVSVQEKNPPMSVITPRCKVRIQVVQDVLFTVRAFGPSDNGEPISATANVLFELVLDLLAAFEHALQRRYLGNALH